MTTLTHSKPYGVGKWPQLSAPIDPYDSVLIARAKSILVALVGIVDLTAEQARTVIDWHRAQG